MRPQVFVAILALGAAGALAAMPDPTATATFDDTTPAIDALIANPEEALSSVPKGFRAIVLSNLAEGCVDRAVQDPALAPAAVACVEAARAALPRHPTGSVAVAHTLIVEEAAVYLGLSSARDEALAYDLVEATLNDPLATAPSYVGTSARWPADQAAALYALWLYDQNHRTDRLPAVLAAHDAVMAERGTAKSGLPVSELGHLDYADLPRGCALSWTVRYRAAFDPDGARALWDRYVDQYFVDYGVVGGFREWPPGVERAADDDSGPIVLGIGAAATAFGLTAARTVGDDAIAGRLARTSALGHAAAGQDPDLATVADGPLAAAIEWKAGAASARWFPAPAR